MIILGLPDIHGAMDQLKRLVPRIEEADLVLLIGDITNFGHETDMKEIIEWVWRFNKNVFAVPGNCDYPETEKTMDKMDVNLNGSHRYLGNLAFAGLGASLETPFKGTPFEVSEHYLEAQLKASVNGYQGIQPLVLVSHQPPINTKADALGNGMHVGSKSVREFIERTQPLVCFCGHIHEGRGVDAIGETKIINPGPVFQGNYAYAEIGDRVEILEIRPIG